MVLYVKTKADYLELNLRIEKREKKKQNRILMSSYLLKFIVLHFHILIIISTIS